jgi:hypothetical protein
MRRHDAFVTAISFGIALGCFAQCNPCFAVMLQSEFVQPPSVFVRHTATIEYCGPTVVRLTSGKLAIPGWGFESNNSGRTWSSANTGAWLGSNNVIQLQDGRWAAMTSRSSQLGQGGMMPSIQFSTNEATTWSSAIELTATEGIYYIMNERLIQTNQGALVVAAARGGNSYEGDNNSAGCFYSNDRGTTWAISTTWAQLGGLRGMAEPTIAELDDGRLLMLARTGKGAHHRSYSSDGGRTWSPPEATTLTAACSPLTMKRMPDGRLFVVYDHADPLSNEAFFPRTPLVWALSDDDGVTWSDPHLVDAEAGQQHIYPSITFLEEGILVVYSSRYADPAGGFGGPPDSWKIGGGKSCIIAYPCPEPGTLALLAVAMTGGLAYTWKNRRCERRAITRAM